MVAGIIFVSVLGTLFHFAYEWSGNNIVVGLFTPVNESTWEHMKLLFFPMLVFSLYATAKLRTQYPCADSAMALATLVGTFLIPVLFYTYSGILGFNLAVIDISTFYISVIAAFYTAYKAVLSCKANKHKSILNILLFALSAAFVVFTVFPLNIGLFTAP